MSALSLLAIAVAGSCFTRSYPRARYQQARSVGWDAYFHVASWGTLFLVVAFCVLAVFEWMVGLCAGPAWLPSVMQHWAHTYGVSVFALRVGIVCLLCMVFGLLLGRLLDNNVNRNAVTKFLLDDHDLERMLYTSSQNGTLIQVSLKSRRVYVGLVFDGSVAGHPKQHEQFLILPMLSGYRATDTMDMALTNSYEQFYREQREDEGANNRPQLKEQFQTLIRVSEISSMAYFSPAAYKGIQSNLVKA